MRKMRKHTSKCIASLLLAIIMLVTGCGANNAVVDSEDKTVDTTSVSEENTEEVLEPVHLKLYMFQDVGTDDELVAEAVNELEEVKALNVTVEFINMPKGDDFTQKLGLELASGSDVDILVGVTGALYNQLSDEGAFADITELLDTKYTTLRDALTEIHWGVATRPDGAIYGVPVYKEMSAEYGLYIQQSVVDDYDLDLSNRNITNITDILEALREDGRATFHFNYAQMARLANIDAYSSYTNISTNYCAALDFDDPSQIVNYYASEDFEKVCLTAREWYEKGLIDSDVLTRENYTQEFNDPELFGLEYTMHSPYAEYAFASNWGMDVAFLQLTPSTSNMNNVGFATCINAKSKNIDRALAFIELWNTNSNVKNTITFGIEGKHYDLVDGQVDFTNYPDHKEMWAGNNDNLGNKVISYTPVGYPEKDYSVYAREGAAARQLPNAGFVFDETNISNEVAALNAVINEYRPLLCSGTVENVEATLDEFLKKLEANGLQKVMDEAQAQWDAFNK